MSLLDNIVAGVLKNSMGQQSHANDPLSSVLGGMLGGQSQGGLGGLLGQVAQSQMQPHANQGLGGVLGSLLGAGQTRQSVPAGDLGSLLGQVVGSQFGGQRQQMGFNKNTLLLMLIPVVLGYIQKNGGLSGMLGKAQGLGLASQANSWVAGIDRDGDGIDVGDIMRLFGRDEIAQVSKQTGASETEVAQGIAHLLPQVVNDLTPNGTLDDEHIANNEISDILRQFAAHR